MLGSILNVRGRLSSVESYYTIPKSKVVDLTDVRSREREDHENLRRGLQMKNRLRRTDNELYSDERLHITNKGSKCDCRDTKTLFLSESKTV